MTRWTRRQWLVATSGLGIQQGLALLPGHAAAADPAADVGGQEWRIVARQGVVRVYRPPRFRARDAGIVLYVHGLFTDIDQAWREHRLPRQFQDSARNALFIAPAARSAAGAPLPWTDLGALLTVVTTATGLAPPPGPVVAAGHSGAYREIGAWLEHPRLRTILLLDGLYGLKAELRAWLGRRARNRMALVNQDTARAVATWLRAFPYAVRRERCPDDLSSLSRQERTAKLLSMGTAATHFGIITEGKLLPLLLQWTTLPATP